MKIIDIKDYLNYNNTEVIQIKITKYSDMIRVCKIIKELHLDNGYFIKTAVNRFKNHKPMYMIYCIDNKNTVRFNQELQKSVRFVSVEYFLENVRSWELIKRI